MDKEMQQMNGVEATRAIRALGVTAHTPIVGDSPRWRHRDAATMQHCNATHGAFVATEAETGQRPYEQWVTSRTLWELTKSRGCQSLSTNISNLVPAKVEVGQRPYEQWVTLRTLWELTIGLKGFANCCGSWVANLVLAQIQHGQSPNEHFCNSYRELSAMPLDDGCHQ